MDDGNLTKQFKTGLPAFSLSTQRHVHEPKGQVGVFPIGVSRVMSRLAARPKPQTTRKLLHYLLQILTRAHGHGTQRRKLPPRVDVQLRPVIEWLEAQSLTVGAYTVSSIYSRLTNERRRRALAMYFTPPALAEYLIDQAVHQRKDIASLRVLDPTCGGAAFLLPFVIRLRDFHRAEGASPQTILRAVRSNVRGIEIDAQLASLTKAFIRIALSRELKQCPTSLDDLVRVGDAIALTNNGRVAKADLLLCNPPYRKIASKERDHFSRQHPNLFQGQGNLYSIFFDLAHRLVRPGGRIVLLTPAGYLSGPSFGPVRELLLTKTRLSSLHLVDQRESVFDQVAQDICALIASREPAVCSQRVSLFRWTATREQCYQGSLAIPRSKAPWYIPREGVLQAGEDFNGNGRTIEQCGYSVRVGPYVWNRDKRRRFINVPKGALRKSAVPILWASHIRPDGTFQFGAEGKRDGHARFIFAGQHQLLGFLEGPCVLIQRTSTRAQRKRLVAAPVSEAFFRKHPRAIAENHVIALIPIGDCPRVPVERMAQVLNESAASADIAALSNTANITVEALKHIRLQGLERYFLQTGKHDTTSRMTPHRKAHSEASLPRRPISRYSMAVARE